MDEEDKRNIGIYFKVNACEKTYIENKFADSNYKSKSDFLRKTVAFAKVIPYPKEEFLYIRKQLSGACNNINQIAYQANRNRTLTAENIQEITNLNKILFDVWERVDELDKTMGMSYGNNKN
jgi:macrodomain Ter protein organizer (MatP/YcbG family)